MSEPITRTIYMTVEVTVTGDDIQFATASVNDPSNCTVYDEDGDSYDLPTDQYQWYYGIEEALDAQLSTPTNNQ